MAKKSAKSKKSKKLAKKSLVTKNVKLSKKSLKSVATPTTKESEVILENIENKSSKNQSETIERESLQENSIKKTQTPKITNKTFKGFVESNLVSEKNIKNSNELLLKNEKLKTVPKNQQMIDVGEIDNDDSIDASLPAETKKNRWFGLIMLSLALFMIIIDATVLNVSQREIIVGLKTDLQAFQWSTTLYALIMTSLIITGGRLGDIFGRKKMFLVGAVTFAIGSIIAGLSKNIETLTLGRSVVAGIGAALMMPATSSLVASNFHGKDRNIAFAIWGMVAGTAAALGPLIGGYFTSTPGFGWEWAFFINVGIVLFILAMSKFIPEAPLVKIKEKTKIDFRGILLSATSLGLIIYGVIESSTYGIFKAKEDYKFVNGEVYKLPGDLSISFYTIILGSVLLFVLWKWLARARSKDVLPLIDLSLFKHRNFNLGLIVSIILAVGQTGFVFSLPAYLQIAHGLNAFESGKALLSFSLAAFISAPLSGFLSSKFQKKYLLIAGFLIGIVGVIFVSNHLNTGGKVSDIYPGLFIFGFGFGLINGPIANLTLSSIGMDKYGEASGVQGMVRQFGSTLGVAIIGTVFLTSLTNDLPKELASSTVMTDKYKEVCANYFSNTGNIYRPVDISKLPCDAQYSGVNSINLINDVTPKGIEQLVSDIKNSVAKAVVHANKDAFKWNIVFFVLAIFLCLLFKERFYRKESIAKNVQPAH